LNVQDDIQLVVGNPELDNYLSNTVYGKLNQLIFRLNAQQHTYPTLADAVELITGSGTSWTLGNKIEIIPENAINQDFGIIFFNTGLSDAVTTFDVTVYKGNAGSEIAIGNVRPVRMTQTSGCIPLPFQCEIITKNTRISAAIASQSGNVDKLKVSLTYFMYEL